MQLLENILHEVWGENYGHDTTYNVKWKPTNVQQVAKEERKALNDQRIEHGNH